MLIYGFIEFYSVEPEDNIADRPVFIFEEAGKQYRLVGTMEMLDAVGEVQGIDFPHYNKENEPVVGGWFPVSTMSRTSQQININNSRLMWDFLTKAGFIYDQQEN